MADLLDIAQSTACEAVWIDGRRISVRGLSFNAGASIISRFPNIIDLFRNGYNPNLITTLIEQFGASVGPIIAAGCGHQIDEKFEQAADAMVMEKQAILLEPILRLTFPNGVGPFAERVNRIALVIAGEGAKKPVVKIRSRKSPSSSPDSSGADSRPTLQ